MGFIIVLQIEHIGLEFNIKVSPFLSLSSHPAWIRQKAGGHSWEKTGGESNKTVQENQG